MYRMWEVLCKLSLSQMEEKLGFTANSMTPPDPATERFYSDLKLVPYDTSKQLVREYEEMGRTDRTPRPKAKTSLVLPKMGESLAIEYDGNRVVITREDRVGLYTYSIDINYNGGFFLPLLFTEIEASWAISNAKFPSIETPHDDSPFLKLPRELREKIYSFALPQRELGIKPYHDFDSLIFPAGVGDPSGFFFQLGREPTLLKASRQIRQEALPFAYRNTTFCLDDMDDLVKFLVAIGHVGRSNITSLQFPWESMNDIWRKEKQFPPDGDSGTLLPSLHTLRCVQLLKECRRLQFLQISLHQEILEYTSVHEFMADPGIASLCTLRGIRTLEVVDNTNKSIEEHPAVKRLHEEMKRQMSRQSDSAAAR